jgi:hypothetical protein
MTQDTPRYSKADLLQETARIDWQGLERHFARGVVLQVDPALDLVEVATCFANDNRETVEGWLASGQVRRLPNEVARDWVERDPELWAAVVAPWVVVQERDTGPSGS